ncbi:hypothetical protein G9P44_002020 [Scheffersomyces stipitis]|nr:hypothetical protein G9P44_002020 [Scheffersomyces stipitis]
MICIECANTNIDCLFSRYKSEYIKLTICPGCGKIADKYIEYDYVILFIDILLLKKQAYRHLAFNVTELELLKDTQVRPNHKSKADSNVSVVLQCFQFLSRYRSLFRMMFLIILIEVYLMWAFEEKKTHNSISMRFVLNQDTSFQYSYFMAKSVVEQLSLNIMIQILFRYVFGWGKIENKNIGKEYQYGYWTTVLLIGVLVPSSIRLFPILMLIWPYDTATISTTLINIISSINNIEALRVVTDYKYHTIVFILSVSVLFQLSFSKLFMSIILHHYSAIGLNDIFRSEYEEILQQVRDYKSWVRAVQESISS